MPRCLRYVVFSAVTGVQQAGAQVRPAVTFCDRVELPQPW